MTLPNVLIIGAMKAGTTSLYMDIADRPGAYLAQEKEPHALCDDYVLTSEGLAAYKSLYAAAPADAICCDASTGYAKRPDFEGVARRAVQVLPSGFKAIYLVRHPIDRIVSQHHHEVVAGSISEPIEEAIRRHPRFIQYSRYFYQLTPWLEAVGPERILVVRFEDYVNSRADVMASIWRFVGLSAEQACLRRPAAYNRSLGKPVLSAFWQSFRENPLYRRVLRPVTPLKCRLSLRSLLLPKTTVKLSALNEESVSYLRDALWDDVHSLRHLLGNPSLKWQGFDAR